MTTHIEIISCPKCDAVQQAMVEHTLPWYTYFHICSDCGATITESEWERVIG